MAYSTFSNMRHFLTASIKRTAASKSVSSDLHLFFWSHAEVVTTVCHLPVASHLITVDRTALPGQAGEEERAIRQTISQELKQSGRSLLRGPFLWWSHTTVVSSGQLAPTQQSPETVTNNSLSLQKRLLGTSGWSGPWEHFSPREK